MHNVAAITTLTRKKTRQGNEFLISFGAAMIFVALWLNKGLGLVFGGFVPNSLHEITEHIPTTNKLGITIGVWATGFLVLSLLYKIAVGVEYEVA